MFVERVLVGLVPLLAGIIALSRTIIETHGAEGACYHALSSRYYVNKAEVPAIDRARRREPGLWTCFRRDSGPPRRTVPKHGE